MQLTLGPVLFNWRPDDWRDFYFRIADEAPVDVVVVGEVVCSKRLPFLAEHMDTVLDRLSSAGKTVVLGSLLMVTLERERRETTALAQNGKFMVEANDVSCLMHLAGRDHALGPFINVYNEDTARLLAGRGARRICLPQELPLSSIATIAKAVPDVAIEVHAFGRVPLAISARCYHARLHGLSKDNCRFICEEDPDGLTVNTLDGKGFLAINGVQTMSHTCANLLRDVPRLMDAGVGALRLSPQTCDMVTIAEVFRDVIDGLVDTADGHDVLSCIYPEATFSNGFLHAREGAHLAEPMD